MQDRETAATTRSETQERAMEFADKTKEKVSEVGHKAQAQADEQLHRTAGTVESAAQKVREKAYQQEGIAADAGVKVAEGMEKSADYLRAHDTQEILDDVERYVREHPMQAVAGAVIGGFLIGRILR